MVGGVGFGASSAQAQVASGAARTPVRRSSYVPSPNGYGNHAVTPPTASMYRLGGARIVTGSISPSFRAHAAPRPFRDWSIGRDMPLAKPWLQPLR